MHHKQVSCRAIQPEVITQELTWNGHSLFQCVTSLKRIQILVCRRLDIFEYPHRLSSFSMFSLFFFTSNIRYLMICNCVSFFCLFVCFLIYILLSVRKTFFSHQTYLYKNFCSPDCITGIFYDWQLHNSVSKLQEIQQNAKEGWKHDAK